MAVDDVVSDWEETIAGGAEFSVQPSSGVEWLVSWAGMNTTDTTHHMVTRTGGSANVIGAIAPGATGATNLNMMEAMWSAGGQRLFVTNREYFVILNGGASARDAAYSAIQTK